MKPEENQINLSQSEINDRRLKELELKVQYQEIEKELARAEGRREGIKYVIEMIAVVLTILIGAGIFTLWNTTQNFQERMLTDIQGTASAREIELGYDMGTRVSSAISEIETRTIQSEDKRAAEVGTRIVEEELTRTAELITRVDIQVEAFTDDINTRTAVLSDTVGILNDELPMRVYNAVDHYSDPIALKAVAIEVVQTRADIAVQDSFSQTVKLAVEATNQAIFITATAEAIEVGTSTPMPTATPTP